MTSQAIWEGQWLVGRSDSWALRLIMAVVGIPEHQAPPWALTCPGLYPTPFLEDTHVSLFDRRAFCPVVGTERSCQRSKGQGHRHKAVTALATCKVTALDEEPQNRALIHTLASYPGFPQGKPILFTASQLRPAFSVFTLRTENSITHTGEGPLPAQSTVATWKSHTLSAAKATAERHPQKKERWGRPSPYKMAKP